MRCNDHKITLRVVSGTLAEEYVSTEDHSRSPLFPNEDHHLFRTPYGYITGSFQYCMQIFGVQKREISNYLLAS